MTPGTDPSQRDAALRPPLAILALLLFVWPLVRDPPLSLLDGWLHLFASWSLLIVVLFALSRAGHGRARDDDGKDRVA